MPMNLVVIPLEGISQLLFWQYRDAMPSLWWLSNHAISFRRFYSNSTSAFSSFCDFVHGDSSELDHNLAYPSAKGCLLGRRRNFFGLLKESGYDVLGIQHGELCPRYLRENVLGAWPESCGEFHWHSDYDSFYNESFGFIEQSKAAGRPFAVYFSDRAGTVADNCMEKQENVLYHERFAKGFSLVDQSVGKVLKKLADLSLLDNTVIAVYGAYGMDPWKHGVYGGRMHAIAPYADMCWTPMFLYNNNRDAKIIDNLSCVIDLKATLLGLLLPDQPLDGIGPFSGVNLLKGARDVVFTQNLFALERENEGPARGLIKCYSATDGDQRLIVSSDGGIAGDGGMEFYYDPRDPANTRNLLDFFTLDDKGAMVSFGRNDATHPHFLLAWHPDKPEWLIQPVVNSYNAMRGVLKTLVKSKEQEALEHCATPTEARFFSEALFNYKRRRQ